MIEGNPEKVRIITTEVWVEFLERCGKALNIVATKVYNVTGAEIDATEFLIPNETIYVSCGESFVSPCKQSDCG